MVKNALKIKFKGNQMFKLPHQEWLEKQPKHTQIWLANQAIWHDSDMMLALAIGFAIGVCVGCIV